ncbi:high mobility group B protein 14 [Hevea brasiliensis]|uniref:high mobility group B protein 14 n=1 Tax=Hevea brasiliensis TaxID=3981 RepID=UPI0025D64110|nr:high mobility group B protein 14 [Hevea brasiliensis]
MDFKPESNHTNPQKEKSRNAAFHFSPLGFVVDIVCKQQKPKRSSNSRRERRKSPPANLRHQKNLRGDKEKRPKSAMKLKRRPKKKSVKIDTKRPKKSPTAFFFFFMYVENHQYCLSEDFQEQNPDVKSMRDIGKACGEKWKTMSYEDKVKYYDIAMEKRAVFDKAMAEYIKKRSKGKRVKMKKLRMTLSLMSEVLGL